MLFWGLLLLSLYLPFQVALNPSSGIDLASIRVFILVLFLLWLARSLVKRKVWIKNNFTTGLIITFLFLSSFSILVARNTNWSWRKLAYLFSIFPIYFVAADILKNRDKMVKVIKALVYGGFLASVIGLVQFFLQFLWGREKIYQFWAGQVAPLFLGQSFSQAVLENPSWLVGISGRTYLRATGLFPDPHMFSFFLGLLIPLALGLALEFKKKRYWIIFLSLLAADILTFSRGGYLGLFAGALMMLILFWGKIGKKYKTVFLVTASLFILLLTIPSPVSSRFLSSFNLREGSNQGRIVMWRKASEVIWEHPWTGTGIGNYPLEVKAAVDYREPIYAHNTYLDIAAETGILNALVWIGLLAASLTGFLRKSKNDPLFLGASISIVIFSVHSLAETGLYSPVVLTTLLLIISFNSLNTENEKVS